MSRWGIGPAWTLLSMAWAAVVFVVQHRWFPDLEMIWPPVSVGFAMGILLMSAGTVVFLCGLSRLRRAWREERLETDGIYAWVRHPIYSAFIMFIIPAAVLMARSILGLSIPIVMYVLFRILIQREERELSERFGDEYQQWRRRTSSVLPTPPMPGID